MMPKTPPFILLGAFGLLAACQTAGPAQVQPNRQVVADDTSGQPTADASDAEQLAYALWQASAADQAGNRVLLATMLERIDALGARPATQSEQAQLDLWQRRAAPGSPPMRGRLHGPGFQSGWLDAGMEIDVEQTFLSGQRASIALAATRGPALEMEVEDGNAREICSRDARRSTCRWVPVFTQRHRIRLTNPGSAPAYYHLVIE